MNDKTTTIRPVSIYYPSVSSRPYGYGYKDMRPNEPRYMNFNSDNVYTQLHSRTPNWEGMLFDDVKKMLPRKWRVVNLYNVDYYRQRDRFDAMRLTIFIDDRGVITSLAYA
jgi:hypothetical protein